MTNKKEFSLTTLYKVFYRYKKIDAKLCEAISEHIAFLDCKEGHINLNDEEKANLKALIALLDEEISPKKDEEHELLNEFFELLEKVQERHLNNVDKIDKI